MSARKTGKLRKDPPPFGEKAGDCRIISASPVQNPADGFEGEGIFLREGGDGDALLVFEADLLVALGVKAPGPGIFAPVFARLRGGDVNDLPGRVFLELPEQAVGEKFRRVAVLHGITPLLGIFPRKFREIGVLGDLCPVLGKDGADLPLGFVRPGGEGGQVVRVVAGEQVDGGKAEFLGHNV